MCISCVRDVSGCVPDVALACVRILLFWGVPNVSGMCPVCPPHCVGVCPVLSDGFPSSGPCVRSCPGCVPNVYRTFDRFSSSRQQRFCFGVSGQKTSQSCPVLKGRACRHGKEQKRESTGSQARRFGFRKNVPGTSAVDKNLNKLSFRP